MCFDWRNYNFYNALGNISNLEAALIMKQIETGHIDKAKRIFWRVYRLGPFCFDIHLINDMLSNHDETQGANHQVWFEPSYRLEMLNILRYRRMA